MATLTYRPRDCALCGHPDYKHCECPWDRPFEEWPGTRIGYSLATKPLMPVSGKIKELADFVPDEDRAHDPPGRTDRRWLAPPGWSPDWRVDHL